VAAGTTAVGVGWGHSPEEELMAAGAVTVANEPSDLVAFVLETAA
jgi:phosphoglycolate phosphatase-like HAD superfamily hydrolase